jgi:hypothetical protein
MALLTLGDHCIVSQTTYASHCLLVRRLRKWSKYKKTQKFKK